MDETLITAKKDPVLGEDTFRLKGIQARQEMRNIAASHGIPFSELEPLNRMAYIWNASRRYGEAHSFSEEKISNLMADLNKTFNVQEELEHKICVLLPNTIESLETLSRDYLLGIVTSSSRVGYEWMSRSSVLGCFNKYFRHSITRDDCVYIKPDPTPIKLILKLFDRTDFVYIGDSKHDADAVKKTEGKFILINTHNYGGEELKQINPDWVIERLSELQELLPRIHPCFRK
jgi:HAD superfamily hydrolase (TIGR01549 family)